MPFSSDATKVLSTAEAEARLEHHEYVGTEHLVVALIQARVRGLEGLSADRARVVVGSLIGRGDGSPSEMYITPRLKMVLRFAVQAARVDGGERVSAAHLLRGVLHEGEGVGMLLLTELGLDLDHLQASMDSSKQSVGDCGL